MPGTEKKRSTSSVPPKVRMMDAGMYCTRGTNAFLRMCLTMMLWVDMPLILASLM